jgi:gliding motility-associated-like protein
MLCPGESLVWCGKTIMEDTTQTCTFTSAEGCDSIVTLRVEVFKPQVFQVARDITMTMPPDELTWAFDVTNNDYPTDYQHVILDPPPTKGKVKVQNDQKLLYTPDSDKRSGLDIVHFALCPPANCPDACSEAILTINLDGKAVEEIEKKMPNLITPNGDTYNDFFDPLAYLKAEEKVEVDPGSEELTIFNRWGEIIRHFPKGEYPENGWDGKDEKDGKEGKVVPQGTYYYLLKYTHTKAYQRKGPVNVLK